MKIQCSAKDYVRNWNFTIKISKKEKEALKAESLKQNKTITALIREGYLMEIEKGKNQLFKNIVNGYRDDIS